jgi:hypothetical protein
MNATNITSTPLADALRAALATLHAAEALKCECTTGVCAACRAYDTACDAVESACKALCESDELREYVITDGDDDWTIISRPSTLDEDVAKAVHYGDWERSSSSWWWHGVSRCKLTGEQRSHTVEMPAEEPECLTDDHDWQSPYEVLGGCWENPGVWANGGGVIIREVCAHCGVYRVIDTWAQDPMTGTQGLRTVNYEEADATSLAWIERGCPEKGCDR